MTTANAQFEYELEVFRTEAEAGTQFFYAYLAVRAVAAKNNAVQVFLNQNPLFWNTCLGALQTATLITLGRIFDQKSTHNLDRVLSIAQDNSMIFSRSALGRRKQGNDPEPHTWVDEYLRDAYEPTPTDFRRFRTHIRKWRKIYESNYRDLRHKVFAHRGVSNQTEAAALWRKTSIRELQRMFAFLRSLYEALWHLFFNGRKPVLRPSRYSVAQMRRLPSHAPAVQERITHEVERLLVSSSRRVASSIGTVEK